MTLFRRRKLRRLVEARTIAERNLDAALSRRDSRAISAARKAMTEATNRLLRAEVR